MTQPVLNMFNYLVIRCSLHTYPFVQDGQNKGIGGTNQFQVEHQLLHSFRQRQSVTSTSSGGTIYASMADLSNCKKVDVSTNNALLLLH
jgi:hypothetical protein